MLNTNLFFWIQGMEAPIPVEIGEPLGTEFRLVYAPKAEAQEFLFFYEKNEQISKWNKAILGKWSASALEIMRFVSPATMPLGQGWRNSLVTWELNSPIDANICYERYKNNKGANFDDSSLPSLYLIDLAQQVTGKPISELMFDTSFDTGTIKIEKYNPVRTSNECTLGDKELIDAEVENLRIIPTGEAPEDFEFELLNLSFING